jgi:hypothetical protein
MELHEVKIGDMVSFMHKGKKKLGKVVHRHDGTKNAALAGHVNVAPTDANSTPKTLHVSKLTPANKIKEDIHMANITEAIHELIDNIENGNHVEANNIFNDLLQTKIDALIDAKKVEVSSAMFNTEQCADCDEDVELEEGEVKTANKAKKNEYMRSVRGSHDVLGFGKHGSGRSGFQTSVGRAMHKAGIKPPKPKMNTNSTTQKEDVEKTNEALKGAQHKIDMNKNGKLDAMDFKMLRKKKGMKEETQLDELKKVLVSYIKKAAKDIADTERHLGERRPSAKQRKDDEKLLAQDRKKLIPALGTAKRHDKLSGKHTQRRMKGIETATQKLAKEEVVHDD